MFFGSGQLVVVIANLHRELRKKRGLFLVTIFLAIIAYSIPQSIKLANFRG